MLNFLVNIAHAQKVVGTFDTVRLTNPLKVGSIPALIESVTRYLVGISAALVVLIVVWAAFQLVLKSGDPGARKEALDRIKWAVIGFGIMLLAGGIVSFVVGFLGGAANDIPSSSSSDDFNRLAPQLETPSIFNSSPVSEPKPDLKIDPRFPN